MSSNDKIKVKAIENSCILLGICFLFAALLLMLGYQFFEYEFNKILLTYLILYTIITLILLSLIAFRDVKQIKFYKIFGFLVIFVWIFMILYCVLIDKNTKIQFLIIIDTSVLASSAIIFINNLITRVFFWEGDVKNSQDVDAVSSEFAVDVLSIALFLGIILGLFAYLFFVPNQATPSFFGGIDIKTVALATAGLITFFWGAKAAKNKSIELEEKKQDGKRRDKEIKMADARDTAQLVAKASELLGSENDAQKYAGLAFLNTVASQKGGPFQKEAFDLLADFILSATDTTTSNKPRIRAISYANNLLEGQCHDFELNKFIGISRDMKNQDDLTINLKKYVFKNLNIAYYNFCFFSFSVILNTYSPEKVCYEKCDFIGFHKGDIPDIPIFVYDCHFVGCEIKVFKFYGYQDQNRDLDFYYNFVTNTFEKCDFSGIKFWEELRFRCGETLKPENFVECYFFNEDPPEGFNADRDKKFLVGYDRQDADEKQSEND